MEKARYIMIGGFLGAGKTTALLQLARRLSQLGLRVGLITNDQSSGLVDTALLQSHGFSVEEITGGCFCCKFNSLRAAAGRLTAESRPEVFLAEPVGSCTDLKATVAYPLRQIYGEEYAIAPFSVMVDPARASRILGFETGRAFSAKVSYIYMKQLEEAEIIVINKCDLLPTDRIDALADALHSRFPQAEVLRVSARRGTGLDEWLAAVLAKEASNSEAMEVDYDVYAEGEALLGWLNAVVRLNSPASFDGNAFLQQLAGVVRRRLESESAEVAHFKMTLQPADDGSDIAVINLVRNDASAELSHALQAPVENAILTLNLRAEADPDRIKSAVLSSLQVAAQATTIATVVDHLECFRPARPTPTHRLARL